MSIAQVPSLIGSGQQAEGSGDTFIPHAVHNGLLYLIMTLDNFSNQQMNAGQIESETINLLTNCEINLSNAMMSKLNADQAQITNLIDNPPGDDISSATNQAALQKDQTQYSLDEQTGQINTQTIQGLVQASQTVLQMLMTAMQSQSGMYDGVASKESYDASLVTS